MRTTGGRWLGAAVVAMVSVLFAGEAPLTLTDPGEIVQVAPVGQPLATLRLTVPLKPFCPVTPIVELPPCPGAEMLMGEGLAATLKSETATVVAPDVEAA